MIAKPTFRVYEPTDRAKCLRLFDENCPEFFAPNEREDYSDFLAHDPKDYVVVSSEDKILAAYGLHPLAGNAAALHWILLSRSLQGTRARLSHHVARALPDAGQRSITAIYQR